MSVLIADSIMTDFEFSVILWVCLVFTEALVVPDYFFMIFCGLIYGFDREINTLMSSLQVRSVF